MEVSSVICKGLEQSPIPLVKRYAGLERDSGLLRPGRDFIGDEYIREA